MKLLSAAWMLCLLFILPFSRGSGDSVPPAGEDYSVSLEGIAVGSFSARTAVHDPSVIAADGTYYIFGSHMVAASSSDLRSWAPVGSGRGYSPANSVWGNLFSADSHVFDYAGLGTSLIPTDDRACHVWAPDAVYNPVMGKYMLYYCTSSTWNASNLCFGVSDSVTGPYIWQAALIYSGFDMQTVSGTNVLSVVSGDWVRERYLNAGAWNYKRWPNAIDPCVFFDGNQRMWMVYGSWSGGIFLLELDPATGLVIHPEADDARDVDPYFGRRLMGGNHQSIEGPYIQYDPESDYYYLFVSYGSLTREGGYQIRVFRSREPDGDYEDMNGRHPGSFSHSLFGLKLSGNYTLPSVRTAYMATGHNSALIDADGKKYVVCHTRFDNGTENHLPLVRQYGLNAEGWPCLLPYSTRGETLEADLSGMDLSGRYYVINQGTRIDAQIAKPFILYLRPDGTVGGERLSGVWTLEGSFLHLSLGRKDYSGIVCRMQDDAGTPVTVFSAAGNNESVWGVRYD